MADETDRKRATNAEESLRLSEQRASLLIEAVTDYAIFTLDPNGVVSSWNPGAQRLKGYRAEEIIGQHFSRFYPRADVLDGKCERELVIALREGRFEEEGWRVRSDGSLFFASVIITPMRDLSGQLLGFAKVTRDLTEPRKAEARRTELAAENAALVERARVQEFQERFLAILGHDLRNPLAAIDMGVGILRQSSGPGQARILNRMSSSLSRMSRMIEQILDLTRSRLAGGIEIQVEPTDLSVSLKQVVDELRVAHPSRQLVLRCPETLPGELDRDRLEQVFSNIIGNAVSYGDPESPVIVEASLENALVTISIHNHGPPIPEELLNKLFDPFRRGVRDSKGPRTQGLGLGLFISNEIVVGHGGSIDVRSSETNGTTFRVTLPLFAAKPQSLEGYRR